MDKRLVVFFVIIGASALFAYNEKQGEGQRRLEGQPEYKASPREAREESSYDTIESEQITSISIGSSRKKFIVKTSGDALIWVSGQKEELIEALRKADKDEVVKIEQSNGFEISSPLYFISPTLLHWIYCATHPKAIGCTGDAVAFLRNQIFSQLEGQTLQVDLPNGKRLSTKIANGHNQFNSSQHAQIQNSLSDGRGDVSLSLQNGFHMSGPGMSFDEENPCENHSIACLILVLWALFLLAS